MSPLGLGARSHGSQMVRDVRTPLEELGVAGISPPPRAAAQSQGWQSGGSQARVWEAIWPPQRPVSAGHHYAPHSRGSLGKPPLTLLSAALPQFPTRFSGGAALPSPETFVLTCLSSVGGSCPRWDTVEGTRGTEVMLHHKERHWTTYAGLVRESFLGER